MRNQPTTPSPLRPILRWIGGKQHLLHELLKHCPPDTGTKRYFEPFLGAASLFLALQPQEAFLSDANPHLIDAYKYISRNPLQVFRLLSQMSKKDSHSFYYNTRNKYNHSHPSASQAARFLYLNRTCFNGIFRVNKANKFNVPYAYKTNPHFPDQATFLAFAKVLKRATLTKESYQAALSGIGKDDFVYLDPPYPSLNGTSNFSHYTMNRFNTNDQHDLAKQVRRIHKLHGKFMLSNADTKLIRQLYRGFNLCPVLVTRFVTCKAIRHQVRELIITNY